MGHTARARHGICPQGCGSVSATLQTHPTPSTTPSGSREGTDPGKPKAEMS